MSKCGFVFAIGLLLGISIACRAQEPGWSGSVIASGTERERIEATPIEQRPYRPLHFYGNTVRRQYYRGSPLPAPRDFVQGAAALLGRR